MTIELGPFTAADYEPLPRRAPIFTPPNGKDGYQVESWIDKQLSKGAVLRDRDGNPIRVKDGMLLRPMAGGSFITGTSQELIYANLLPGTAKATFTAEFQINDTAGMGLQAHLPVDFWTPSNFVGKGIRIEAYGIVSSVSNATFQWTTRSGTAGGTSAAIMAGTAALTTATTITNLSWSCWANIVLTATSTTGAVNTVRGHGVHNAGNSVITTNSGVNPYNASASATAPTATTMDDGIVNYINFNVVCGTSSASNSIQLLGLYIWGLN